MSAVRPGRRRRDWSLAVLLLIAAWLLAFVTPAEDAATAPFVVSAQPGEEAAGRNISATVTGIRAAETLSGGWAAAGVWLIVDLEVASVLSEQGVLLGHATLQVADRSYRASERPPSLFRQTLAAGIPQSGSLAFELPDAAFAGTAVLRLGLLEAETRLDSLLEVPLDLAGVAPEAELPLQPTRWATP